MWMYICMCMYIYVCVCRHVCTCLHVYAHMCLYCKYMHVWHVNICFSQMPSWKYMHLHAHTFKTCTYVHTCNISTVQVCTYVHVYTCTCAVHGAGSRGWLWHWCARTEQVKLLSCVPHKTSRISQPGYNRMLVECCHSSTGTNVFLISCWPAGLILHIQPGKSAWREKDLRCLKDHEPLEAARRGKSH
jgi:hypothetical protein